MKLPQNYNNLTPTERRLVRALYVKEQGAICYHCGGALSEKPPKEIQDKRINLRLFPKGFLKWPIHLHHDHNTGMTIGAVHARCNAVLWQYHGE